MARDRGPLGSSFSGGAVLDTLIVKIECDLSGLQRGIAAAIGEIRTLKGAIASQVGGVSLADAMNAALVAPVLVATARLGQMREQLRAVATQMSAIAAAPALQQLPAAAAGVSGALAAPMVIDATRTGRARGANGRYARGYSAESDDLRAAAAMGAPTATPPGMIWRPEHNGGRGAFVPIGGFWDRHYDDIATRHAPQPRAPGPFAGLSRAFGGLFGREANRTGAAFERGRDAFPGFTDAADNLGASAHGAGQAGRRAVGGGIARALGLVGLGALFGDLIKLAASLATIIAGTLAGAFAALATPLGLVVVAITALVGLFVAANWDSFVKFGEWFGDRAKILLGEAAGDIAEGWRDLGAAFHEVWLSIKDRFGLSDDSALHVLQFFGEVVLRTLNAIGEAIGGLLRVLAEIVNAIAALIRGDWVGIWEHAKEAFSVFVATIKETFLSLFPELRKGWDDFFGWFAARARDMAALIGRLFAPSDDVGGGVGAPRRRPSSSEGDAGGAGFIPASFTLGGGRRGRAANDNGAGEEARLERLGRLADEFGWRISGAFEEAVAGGRKFGDVLKSLIADLIMMVLRMALIEPMARAIADAIRGVFSPRRRGGGGDGPINTFAGFFAKGGELAPGKWGIVGENGPEIVMGGRAGAVIAPMGAGGLHVDARAFIDATGADAAAIARLETALARRDAELPGRIRATVGDMGQRGRLGFAA